jgi:hypothetical protein
MMGAAAVLAVGLFFGAASPARLGLLTLPLVLGGWAWHYFTCS